MLTGFCQFSLQSIVDVADSLGEMNDCLDPSIELAPGGAPPRWRLQSAAAYAQKRNDHHG